ncbi:thiamine pyrophosphate-binding protein, partial [Saccharopolyspora sp. WRP15-2]
MTRTNGGDLLVQVMRDNGVDTAFGVVSVHNLPLVEAVSRDLRFVPVRHEAAAVNAADGYARATGGLGVAITSTGTGAGNAAGAMVEALTAGSRVLHVTGQIDSPFLGQGRGVIHETKDQASMLAAISKHSATVASAGEAGSVLREAVRSALSVPSGPSSVEWPIDLQYAEQQVSSAPAERGATPPSVDPASVRSAVEVIRSAERPLLWVGGGGTGAGELVRELAELLSAGVLTSNSGRGSVPEDHELVIGNFAANPEAAPLLAEADLLISIGTHFRSNETKHYSLQLPAKHVQIDVDPAAVGRVHPAAVGLTGETEQVLPQLLAELAGTTVGGPDWRAKVTSTRAAVRAHLRSAIGRYQLICDAMRQTLPAEAVIARDVTIPSSQWGNRLLEIYRPNTNVF